MLDMMISGVKVRLSMLFFAVLTALMILDKSGVAAWCFVASVMHEGGHLAALFLFSVRPRELCFGAFGMRLVTPPSVQYSYRKQAVVALAGPLVNILCAAVLWLCGGDKGVMMVHIVIGAFNLLPIAPLDGGQALRCMLLLHLREKAAETVSLVVSLVVLTPLSTLGFFLLLQSGYNFSLLLVSGYLALLILFKRKD